MQENNFAAVIKTEITWMGASKVNRRLIYYITAATTLCSSKSMRFIHQQNLILIDSSIKVILSENKKLGIEFSIDFRKTCLNRSVETF